MRLALLRGERDQDAVQESAEPGEAPGFVILPYGRDGLAQPLCAVYPRSALDIMESHFTAGIRKVTAALDGLAVEPLRVAELSVFQNVNTPEDWAGYAAK